MKVNLTLNLEAVCRTDLECLRTWRNNHKIWQWCRQDDVISDIDQERWFERQSSDPTIRMYVITIRVDTHKTQVGVCGFTSIDQLNRRAEFSLYIGPEHQQRGFGREALKVLLQHGFLNLGLEQIWGESFEGNPAMKIFDELGFSRDGVRRDFYFKDGHFVNAHLFSILRPEWISSLSASPSPSSSSQSPSMSPPSSPGLKKGATMDPSITPIRQRVARKAKDKSESLHPFPTSGPGSLSKRSESESSADYLLDAPGLRPEA